LLALACVLALNISPNGQTEPARREVPKLPRPTGSFGVGGVAIDWIDPNRRADMAEDRGPHAELMVYVWYPTEAAIKEAKGILLPGAKEIDSAPNVSDSLKSKPFGAIGRWSSRAQSRLTQKKMRRLPRIQEPFPLFFSRPAHLEPASSIPVPLKTW